MSNTETTKPTEADKSALMEMVNGPSEEAGKEETSTEAPASETTQEEPAKDSAETDWKTEARKWENRSKENKEKADKYEEATSKISELETQVNDLTDKHKSALDASALEVTRWKVAAKYKLSEEDVELFLNATDEDTLIKQAERLSQSSTHAPKPDSAQGKRNDTGPVSTKQQGAAALSGLFN